MTKRKITVYGPNGSDQVAAAVEGLEAQGYRAEHRYHGTFAAGNAVVDGDAAVVFGTRGKAQEIAAAYLAAGLPVIQVREALLSEPGRVFVGLAADPTWLPVEAAAGAGERRAAAGIEVAARKRVKAQSVLILGQPAAGAVGRAELAAWYDQAVSTLRRVTDSRLVYLPAAVDDSRGSEDVDEVLDRATALAEALAGAWLVVTHSSPAGLDALVAGLPVVDAGAAPYSSLAGSLQRFGAVKAPSRAAVERLIDAVLSAQWTVEELSTGEAFIAPLSGERFEAGAEDAAPEPAAPEDIPEPAEETKPDTKPKGGKR